jgi:fatty acid desaturase
MEPISAQDSVQDRPLGRPEVRATVKHLRTEVNDGVFLLKLGVCAVLAALGAFLALQSPLGARIAGVVVLGCMFAHAAELQHQALHGLGLRNRRANAAIGVALGVPMLISFAAYRATHLRHHRDLGTPANREFFDYGGQYGSQRPRSRPANALIWLLRFSMVRHYASFAVGLLRALRGREFVGETASTSRRIRRDHFVILATVLAVAGWSVAVGSSVLLWIWVLPLLIVAGPVHAAIELPEHFRCETLSLDPFANTRTIRSNRLMTWFTNGNNFHVEHHLMPNLPIERLPELHGEVRDRLRYVEPGYYRFFRNLIQGR